MKGIGVFPGKPDSVHLVDLPEPSVDDIPNGRGVLVEALNVGLDGTDAEINAAEYGEAPEGYDFLVIGHESFGRVLEAGPNVQDLKPGDYVAATVRRPGGSIYDRIGASDMTTDATYYERGISLLHGYLTERYVDRATSSTARARAETQMWATAAGASARMAASRREKLIASSGISASEASIGSSSRRVRRPPVSGSHSPNPQSRIDSSASCRATSWWHSPPSVQGASHTRSRPRAR